MDYSEYDKDFGLNLSQYEFMETIMKCPYFKGYKSNSYNAQILNYLCVRSQFNILNLIVKYSEKNEDIIVTGLNLDKDFPGVPLVCMCIVLKQRASFNVFVCLRTNRCQ